MQFGQSLFQKALMNKPKQQVLESIHPDWIDYFAKVLLPYTSEFFNIQTIDELYQILGSWLYQIILNSNNDEIHKKYEQYFNKPEPTEQELFKLSEEIFEVQKASGLPSTDLFEKLGIDLQLSFEYEKHRPPNPSTYLRIVNGKKTDFQYTNFIQYRIIMNIIGEQQVCIMFSQMNKQQLFKQQQSAVFLRQATPFMNPPQGNQTQKFQQQNNYFPTSASNASNTNQFQQLNKSEQFKPNLTFQPIPCSGSKEIRDQKPFQIQENKSNIQVQQFQPSTFTFNPGQLKTSFQQINPSQQQNSQDQIWSNQKRNPEETDTSFNKFNGQQLQRSNTFNIYPNIKFTPQQINNNQIQRFCTPNNINVQNSQKQFQTNIQFNNQQQPCSLFVQDQQKQTIEQIYQDFNDFDTNRQIDVLATYKEYSEAQQVIQQQSQTQSVIPLQSILQASVKSIECTVCLEKFGANTDAIILTPCCKEKIHKQCYIDDLITKANEFGRFDQITCFKCKGCLDKELVFLKIHIPFELMLRLIQIHLLKIAPLKCYCCSTLIQISQKMQEEQHEYQCTQCKSKICTLCRQPYHGQNQKNQQCPGIRAEILKAMEGKPITVCPFCDLIQTKDNKCNHITCSSCKNDLCSVCSMDRAPIIGHGNHYHRKGCSDYQPWIDPKTNKEITKEEKDTNKCKRCKESKKACKYPISLEEYKKMKNY